MRGKWLNSVMKVNKELLLILSIIVFAAIINFFVAGQKLVLSFYDLPTLFAAYYFGRARAVQTALASVLIVACCKARGMLASGTGMLRPPSAAIESYKSFPLRSVIRRLGAARPWGKASREGSPANSQ